MARTKTLKILSYGIFALIVIGLAVYLFLIHREKAQFAQAEREIDALYAQIVEKVGKPDQEKKTKYCDRPNLKFEKGPLSCSIDRYILFDNKDVRVATEILNKLSLLTKESLRPGSAATTGTTFADMPVRNGDQRFFQSFKSQTSLSCNLNYTYPSIEQDEFVLNSPSAVVIGLSCHKSALSEYFPVKD